MVLKVCLIKLMQNNEHLHFETILLMNSVKGVFDF